MYRQQRGVPRGHYSNEMVGIAIVEMSAQSQTSGTFSRIKSYIMNHESMIAKDCSGPQSLALAGDFDPQQLGIGGGAQVDCTSSVLKDFIERGLQQ